MSVKQDHKGQERVFAYCHDGVGIGHLARTTAICHRIGRDVPDTSFLIATGTPYVSMFDGIQHADYIKLPALIKAHPNEYQSKFFALPSDNIMQLRSNMLRDSVRFFDPTIVIVDKAPVGVCGELLSALEWLREQRPNTRIVFGMRDIEDAPLVTIAQWQQLGVPGKLATLFDEIWVYGMQQIFDVADHYQLSTQVREKLQYVGYVTRKVAASSTTVENTPPYVLVTVGGGTDGESLLQTFLDEAAGQLAQQGIRSVLVAGPDLPTETSLALQDKASSIPLVEWVPYDPNLSQRIRNAALVVSMGGYNTLCEIAANKKRALIVPRMQPRQEQLMRARLWQDLGILEMIEPSQLSPQLLSKRVQFLLNHQSKVNNQVLDLNGLDRVALRFKELQYKDNESATAVRM